MIRVALIDDHQVIREGLCALLDQQDDMRVVAQVGDGRAALEMVARHGPDVVLCDVCMPQLNGIEATRKIAAAHAATRVIALSAHTDAGNVSDMLEAGAWGYLDKSTEFQEVARGVRAVAAGSRYLSPQIAGTVVDRFLAGRSGDPAGQVGERLSPREREVLQLLAEGQTVKQAALTLGLSHKTVHCHRASIMGKLQLHTSADLTRYAIREGISTL